jgi:hypothetical protein
MATPPEKLGHLIEDSRRKHKNEEIYTYRLDGSFPDGKWVQCAYGEHNQLTLSRKLADDTKRCSVTHTKGEKAAQNHIKIVCE